MGQRHVVQSDFSGGEISTRMMMRAETEIYQKSVSSLLNFMPTIQGTVERTPGTRFMLDPGEPDLRIIPYRTPANQRAIVTISPTEARVKPNLSDLIVSETGAVVAVNTDIIVRQQRMENYRFNGGQEPWVLFPRKSPGGKGDETGLEWRAGSDTGSILGTVREGFSNLDADTCTVSGKTTLSHPTDTITFVYRFAYDWNFADSSPLIFTVKVGTALGLGDLYSDTDNNFLLGQIREPTITVATPTVQWTGEVFVEIKWTGQRGVGDRGDLQRGRLSYFGLWSDETVTIVDDLVVGDPPWEADELPNVHYIQSPYNREIDGKPSKELVLCHHKHPPHRLYFNGTNYVLEPITFLNPPSGWTANNYPATCSSCLGRLVMGGGHLGEQEGDPVTSNTETVWATKVGKWDEFSEFDEVNADDSLEFTTIYRSPIQWVFGQKELMIGAEEMEYIALADGIYAPNDLGVAMHSNHGSVNVQPVGLGQSVLFPGAGGTKVRAMSASNESMGYIAPDLTMWHPELCRSGIKRMVRLRNPHQMMIALLGSGELAVLHDDPYAGIRGWSRMRFGNDVRDICVNTDDEGIDTLYMTIVRTIDDVEHLYLEAIVNWTTDNRWDYMASTHVYSPGVEFSTVKNATHLEGERVFVIGDGAFLGTFTVGENGTPGEVELIDDIGQPIVVGSAFVGLPMSATLRTLPIGWDREGPGAIKRMSSLSVRVRASTKPKMGVLSFNEDVREVALTRSETRSPFQNMERPEPLEFVSDIKVANLGSDVYQTVIIQENLPLRCEILGIYGKLTGESL
jgi:hypothetical protein